MGSIGITSGMLKGTDVDAIFGGRLNFTGKAVENMSKEEREAYFRPGENRAIVPDRINVFPNGNRRDNAFVIDFSNADLTNVQPLTDVTGTQRDAAQAVRHAFLHAWRSPSNVQNGQRSYDATYNRAANERDANNQLIMTEAQARRTAEDARIRVSRRAMERFLANEQAQGRFLGVTIRDFGRRRG